MAFSIYIAAKLFSPLDRYLSFQMCKTIAKIPQYADANIYLPYRDSNEKVDSNGDFTDGIFAADMACLKKTDLLVARLDGMSYDSGIGVEIGFCFALNIPIIAISLDYYSMAVFNRQFMYSPLLSDLCHCPKYLFDDAASLTYEQSLLDNIKNFLNFLSKILIKPEFLHPKLEVRRCNGKKKYDVFIDICGLQYEWCSMLTKEISTCLSKIGCSFYVSDRYSLDFSSENELSILDKSSILFTCLDETEPNIDTAILQGYAYGRGIYQIGYETTNIKRYVEGKQEMHINLMNECVSDCIANNIDDAIRLIDEYLNSK